MAEKITYRLELKSNQMQKSLNDLEKEINDVSKAQKKLKKEGKETTDAFTKNKTVIKDLRGQYSKLQRSIINTAKAQQRGEKSTNRWGSAMKSFAFKFNFLGNAMSSIFLGLTSRIGSFISSSLEAFHVQEQAVADNIAVFGDYSKVLQDTASDIQKVTTVGDEQTLQLMTQARNMGVAVDKTEEATKGAIGLAEKFKKAGLGQETALKGVALAYQGNFSQLERYIPALRNAETEAEKMAILQEEMASGFDLATEAAKTQAGQIQQTGNALGDFKELIGSAFSALLVKILPAINKSLKEINETINDESLSTFEKWAGVLSQGANEAQKFDRKQRQLGEAFFNNGKSVRELTAYLIKNQYRQREINLVQEGYRKAIWANAAANKALELSVDEVLEKEKEAIDKTIKAKTKAKVDTKAIEAEAFQQRQTDIATYYELEIEYLLGRKDLNQEFFDWKKEYERAAIEENNARLAEIDAQNLADAKKAAAKELEISKKLADAKIALEEEIAANKKAGLQQGFDLSVQYMDLVHDRNQIDSDNELALLKSKLDNQLISQEDYDTKVTDIKREAFEEDKSNQLAHIFIDAATAVMKTWAAFAATPYIAAGLSTAIGGVAFKQASNVQAQQFKGATGGEIGGNPHSTGGTNVNMEQGEYLINQASTSRYKPLLSAINGAGNGNRQSDNVADIFDYNKMASAMQSKKVYVVSSEITAKQGVDTKIINRNKF